MTRSDLGIRPDWFPAKRGDLALAYLFRALHVILYAPLRLLHAGRTRLGWAALDLASIPGKILLLAGGLFGARGKAWGLKANALAHTQLVCRQCPAARRALRDPAGRGVCAWNRRWNAGDFTIPPDFGSRNYLSQYAGRTDLRVHMDLLPQPTRMEPRGARAWREMPAWRLWTLSLAFWAAVVAAAWLP